MSEDVLLSRARHMRREPTDAEQKMWRVLRGRQLGRFKFRRQQKLGRFIVDFVCLDRKLVVELDGGQHAENAYDQERDAWLKSRGFEVLRFWNTDVMTNRMGVEHAIAERLGLDWLP